MQKPFKQQILSLINQHILKSCNLITAFSKFQTLPRTQPLFSHSVTLIKTSTTCFKFSGIVSNSRTRLFSTYYTIFSTPLFLGSMYFYFLNNFLSTMCCLRKVSTSSKIIMNDHQHPTLINVRIDWSKRDLLLNCPSDFRRKILTDRVAC